MIEQVDIWLATLSLQDAGTWLIWSGIVSLAAVITTYRGG